MVAACLPWNSLDPDLTPPSEASRPGRKDRYSHHLTCRYCGTPINNAAMACPRCKDIVRQRRRAARRMVDLCLARMRGEIGGESGVYFGKEGGRVTFWFEEVKTE